VAIVPELDLMPSDHGFIYVGPNGLDDDGTVVDEELEPRVVLLPLVVPPEKLAASPPEKL
jgi:hypothetical protein